MILIENMESGLGTSHWQIDKIWLFVSPSPNNWIFGFLAPTGAQREAMFCVRPCFCASVRDIIQKNIENEF